MKQKTKFSSGNFGFMCPKTIETAYDVVEFIHWWYHNEPKSMDIRHYIAWHKHDGYATVMYQGGSIIYPKNIPPLKIGKFVGHIEAQDDQVVINYYETGEA